VWAIYRPDRPRPFDILDFGEFVPLLKQADGWWSQFTALLDYNASQSGRANVVQIAAAVSRWRWFGDWTPGWQLTQAAAMGIVVAQSFVLLRRLGTTALAAAIGASIFLFAPAAARGFVRLTMGEPIGMIFVLGLSLRAIGFQERERWTRDVWWFAAGSALVILTKELMAPTLVLPVWLALTTSDGSMSRPLWSRRNVVLVGTVAIASLATLIPLAIVYLTASSTAFSSAYGSSAQSAAGMIAIWIATLVPFDLVPRQPSAMWAGAVVAFIGLLASGWWIAFHDAGEGRRSKRLFTAAVLFPVLGVLSYAPWPAFEERYSFPYLVGPIVLVAFAVSHLQRTSRTGAAVALTCALVIGAIGLSGAAAHASRADAVQRAADQLVVAVNAQGADSVFVGTRTLAVPAWIGLGPTLSRLAAATDRPWPPTRDVRCGDIDSLVASRARAAVIAFATHCPLGTWSSMRITTVHRFIDWSRWRVASDSVQVGIEPVGTRGQDNVP
jgi:hypothetical protein